LAVRAPADAAVRVLLSEGSSLTSREVITCLGPLGYRLEVVDPDPFCLARWSRWVRAVHRCPRPGVDPRGWLAFVGRLVREREIDVVLPTHEQAWLFSVAESALPVAVAPAGAFARVQSKIEFARLLDSLGLPQPGWRVVAGAADLAGVEFPYWLKTPFSTAAQGVRLVRDGVSRDAALGDLLPARARLPAPGVTLMAQAPAHGQYGQVQALFDHGRLVAVHTNVAVGVGMGGSAAARLSVDHPVPRRDVAVLGEALGWHGGLTLDYMHVDGAPQYIECNPRTVEPGNACASGVNLPELQVRLTLGERVGLRAAVVGRPGVRTHGTIALLLGAAASRGTRRAVAGSLARAVLGRGPCRSSHEQLTPVLRDPVSAVALSVVAARVLASPSAAARVAGAAIARYSITPETVRLVVSGGSRSTR
jgi:hypothetical protein